MIKELETISTQHDENMTPKKEAIHSELNHDSDLPKNITFETEKRKLSEIFEKPEYLKETDKELLTTRPSGSELTKNDQTDIGMHEQLFRETYPPQFTMPHELAGAAEQLRPSISTEEPERIKSSLEFQEQYLNINEPDDMGQHQDKTTEGQSKFHGKLDDLFEEYRRNDRQVLNQQKAFFESLERLLMEQRMEWEARLRKIENNGTEINSNKPAINSNQVIESIPELPLRSIDDISIDEDKSELNNPDTILSILADKIDKLRVERKDFEKLKAQFEIQKRGQLAELKARENVIKTREKQLGFSDKRHRSEATRIEERKLELDSKINTEWDTIKSQKEKLKLQKDQLNKEVESKRKILDSEWKRMMKSKKDLDLIQEHKRIEINNRFSDMERELKNLDKRKIDLTKDNEMLVYELDQKRSELEKLENKIIKLKNDVEDKTAKFEEEKNKLEQEKSDFTEKVKDDLLADLRKTLEPELKKELEREIKKELRKKMRPKLKAEIERKIKADLDKIKSKKSELKQMERELNKKEKNIDREYQKLESLKSNFVADNKKTSEKSGKELNDESGEVMVKTIVLNKRLTNKQDQKSDKEQEKEKNNNKGKADNGKRNKK